MIPTYVLRRPDGSPMIVERMMPEEMWAKNRRLLGTGYQWMPMDELDQAMGMMPFRLAHDKWLSSQKFDDDLLAYLAPGYEVESKTVRSSIKPKTRAMQEAERERQRERDQAAAELLGRDRGERPDRRPAEGGGAQGGVTHLKTVVVPRSGALDRAGVDP